MYAYLLFLCFIVALKSVCVDAAITGQLVSWTHILRRQNGRNTGHDEISLYEEERHQMIEIRWPKLVLLRTDVPDWKPDVRLMTLLLR